MDKDPHLSIRIDFITREKLNYISKYEDRTASNQIRHLINTCIRDFEKKHGEIKITDSIKTEENK